MQLTWEERKSCGVGEWDFRNNLMTFKWINQQAHRVGEPPTSSLYRSHFRTKLWQTQLKQSVPDGSECKEAGHVWEILLSQGWRSKLRRTSISLRISDSSEGCPQFSSVCTNSVRATRSACTCTLEKKKSFYICQSLHLRATNQLWSIRRRYVSGLFSATSLPVHVKPHRPDWFSLHNNKDGLDKTLSSILRKRWACQNVIYSPMVQVKKKN